MPEATPELIPFFYGRANRAKGLPSANLSGEVFIYILSFLKSLERARL